MAQTQDIAFHLANTWLLDCTVEDDAGALIAIAAAEWRVANKTARVILATSGVEITITGLGKCTVKIPPELQTGLTPGIYSHELWVRDQATGDSSIQIVGKLNLADSLKHKYP